jgi:hypothetical protein
MALCGALLFAAPALGQQYQVPTTPQYETPAEEQAPDEGAGETPDTGAAPDAGAGAPEDTIRPQRGAALPHTGFEDGVFLAAAGFVLLLAGTALRRGLRVSQLG